MSTGPSSQLLLSADQVSPIPDSAHCGGPCIERDSSVASRAASNEEPLV